MKESVLLLETKYAESLGALRNVPHWRAAAKGEQTWLRGPIDNGVFQRSLNSLPLVASYFLDAENRLFPKGKKTPVMQMEQFDWLPIAEFLPVTLPVSAMPGKIKEKVELKLSRSAKQQDPAALRTTLKEWINYAGAAPLIRLQQLRFAVSASGVVLVVGTPLPAIKAQVFWAHDNLLLPAGFDFDPPIPLNLLNAGLGKDKNEMIVFDINGNREHIPVSCFNAAKRSVIRSLDKQGNG